MNGKNSNALTGKSLTNNKSLWMWSLQTDRDANNYTEQNSNGESHICGFLVRCFWLFVVFNEEDPHNRMCVHELRDTCNELPGCTGKDWQAGLQSRTHPQSSITIHQISFPLYCKKSASKSVFFPFLKLNIFKTRQIYLKSAVV